MRNIHTIIEDRLFLGNILAARSFRTLAERRITHVLSVCLEPIPAEAPDSGITHRRIPVGDVDTEDILIHFQEACRFIHDALQNQGNVLVHCVQGISRGPTIIAAYTMWSRRISAAEAMELVRRRHDYVWFRPGFAEQLNLFAMCQYAPGPQSGIYVRWRLETGRALQEK